MFCTGCESEILTASSANERHFHVHGLYETFKSTNNQSSNFGWIEETMDLSCILSAVKSSKVWNKKLTVEALGYEEMASFLLNQTLPTLLCSFSF